MSDPTLREVIEYLKAPGPLETMDTILVGECWWRFNPDTDQWEEME